jgi:hypothetical protein
MRIAVGATADPLFAAMTAVQQLCSNMEELAIMRAVINRGGRECRRKRFVMFVNQSRCADVGKFGANIARRGIGMARARKVLAASVIPWENEYGIVVVFERGNHLPYRVGDRDKAERQVQLTLDDPYDPTARKDIHR